MIAPLLPAQGLLRVGDLVETFRGEDLCLLVAEPKTFDGTPDPTRTYGWPARVHRRAVASP